jgi:hypothetical protein
LSFIISTRTSKIFQESKALQSCSDEKLALKEKERRAGKKRNDLEMAIKPEKTPFH